MMRLHLLGPSHPVDGRHVPLDSERENTAALARCDAAELLLSEMLRYCNDQVSGRSVLLAGLRGAGKTTLVASTIQKAATRTVEMRPLKVELLGPNIFPQNAKSVKPIGDGGLPNIELPYSAESEEVIRRRILTQTVLAIYSALCSEVVKGFRRRVWQLYRDAGKASYGYEVSATLEARLPEGPSMAELREYWRAIGALDSGVLSHERSGIGQGMRELVALSGMSYAYQRISGDVSQSSSDKISRTNSSEQSTGVDIKFAEILKPITSVGAGVAVAASIAPKSITIALLSGLATSLAAGGFFKLTETTIDKKEESYDRTFLPDTSADNLDRVLPTLVDRLKRAGLAPVIVFDEMDKVDDLWARHESLLLHMKKLFAEKVFTCSLVNRDFIERLRREERADSYGKNFSYFTHRSYVSYEPKALHGYLANIIKVRT